jgi:hypothetical protein
VVIPRVYSVSIFLFSFILFPIVVLHQLGNNHSATTGYKPKIHQKTAATTAHPSHTEKSPAAQDSCRCHPLPQQAAAIVFQKAHKRDPLHHREPTSQVFV